MNKFKLNKTTFPNIVDIPRMVRYLKRGLPFTLSKPRLNYKFNEEGC